MKPTILFLIVLFAASDTQAQNMYKCSVPNVDISATAATKNKAIFATTQLCEKKSPTPYLCMFHLMNCRETRDTTAWGCQMFTGVSLITVGGATEDDARNRAITQCENTTSLPAICPTFSLKCINLSE